MIVDFYLHELFKLSSNTDNKPPQQMIDFYETRTRNHIKQVMNNIFIIIKKYKKSGFNLISLLQRSQKHDKSKFSEIEYIPYVWLTEFYRKKMKGEKFEYPNKNIENQVKSAIEHHMKNNSHHPEFYNSPKDMSNEDIVEMVCDWAAMSQEFGNSIKTFADNCVGSKYIFSENQKKLIYQLIGEFRR